MLSDSRNPILVVGDDTRIFLSIVRALGRAGKVVNAFPFSPKAASLSSRYIKTIHQSPDYSENPLAWQNALFTLLQGQCFELVIPCADPAIMALDDFRNRLQNQKLAIPSSENISVFFDKEQTHQMCDELDVAHTAFKRLAETDTSDSLISRFGLPLVMKPRRSFWTDKLKAREDVVIAVSREEVRETLESIPDRSRFLVESYFTGDGTGVSILCRNGKVLQAFQHRRLREGWGGCSSYRISEKVNEELGKAVEKISARTDLTGVCMFEFRVNRSTGAWILVEVNARFWGSMQLPLAIGMDFPNWLHELMVHDRVPPTFHYADSVRSRNVLLDANNLLKQLIRQGRHGIFNWTLDVVDFCVQPLRWITGKEKPDTIDIDDPIPALKEFLSVFQRTARGRNKGKSL